VKADTVVRWQRGVIQLFEPGIHFVVWPRAHRVLSSWLHSSNCLANTIGYPIAFAFSISFPAVSFAAPRVESSGFSWMLAALFAGTVGGAVACIALMRYLTHTYIAVPDRIRVFLLVIGPTNRSCQYSDEYQNPDCYSRRLHSELLASRPNVALFTLVRARR